MKTKVFSERYVKYRGNWVQIPSCAATVKVSYARRATEYLSQMTKTRYRRVNFRASQRIGIVFLDKILSSLNRNFS